MNRSPSWRLQLQMSARMVFSALLLSTAFLSANAAQTPTPLPSAEPGTISPSEEIDAPELVKNPYKLKGHAGRATTQGNVTLPGTDSCGGQTPPRHRRYRVVPSRSIPVDAERARLPLTRCRRRQRQPSRFDGVLIKSANPPTTRLALASIVAACALSSTPIGTMAHSAYPEARPTPRVDQAATARRSDWPSTSGFFAGYYRRAS